MHDTFLHRARQQQRFEASPPLLFLIVLVNVSKLAAHLTEAAWGNWQSSQPKLRYSSGTLIASRESRVSRTAEANALSIRQVS